MLTVDVINHDLFPLNEANSFLSLLPASWKNEILKYRVLNDRKSRLMAKVLLLNALAESGLSSIAYKRDSGNKPFIENWYPFNISHSHELTIFCYSESSFEVGIDIEYKKEMDIDEIAPYFHAEEKEYIKSSTDDLSAFYEVWTRKEAVLKAHGTGIINGLDQFSCLTDTIDMEGKCYFLKELIADDEYACFAAVESKIEQPFQLRRIKTFDFEKIKGVCEIITN